ncbi:hypothetical protein IMSHALPRED_006478 [Imshaugia aleurites]|uniref:Uncharacterized protein n=1 Tax=Imshaugia aleurites TaxID=172621 RepID=A0A8H3FLA7_9LECA|nr:hypothetical protein IMSHALPRED_006478 [Imshaugia aleurites]
MIAYSAYKGYKNHQEKKHAKEALAAEGQARAGSRSPELQQNHTSAPQQHYAPQEQEYGVENYGHQAPQYNEPQHSGAHHAPQYSEPQFSDKAAHHGTPQYNEVAPQHSGVQPSMEARWQNLEARVSALEARDAMRE